MAGAVYREGPSSFSRGTDGGVFCLVFHASRLAHGLAIRGLEKSIGLI